MHHAMCKPPSTAAEMVAREPGSPTPDILSPPATPDSSSEEPLYTEINIPLPPLPKPKPEPVSPKSRSRSRSLVSLSPFHRRRRSSQGSDSSCDSTGSKDEDWPRVRKEVRNKEIFSIMSLKSRHHKGGTVDALAVVPAVLVLSAELFTPGLGKKKEAGKWEEGMI